MTRIHGFPLPALGLGLALLAATCSDESAAPPDPDTGGPPAAGVLVVHQGVEYRGEVAVMESFPVQLAGRATLTNPGDEPVDLTFPDGCVVLLRAYRGGERVWDQSSEVGCTMALVPMTLGPGESRTVPAPTVSASEILDQELPDGDYEIRLYLRPDWEDVEVSAGTVALAIPR